LGGIQLVVLGIIGEYLGKLYVQAKHRPDYIVREQSDESAQERLKTRALERQY
jgi:dolichol-phosphate mannosyltransferase